MDLVDDPIQLEDRSLAGAFAPAEAAGHGAAPSASLALPQIGELLTEGQATIELQPIAADPSAAETSAQPQAAWRMDHWPEPAATAVLVDLPLDLLSVPDVPLG